MSSIELTEYARGGGKTEKDAPSQCCCAVPGKPMCGAVVLYPNLANNLFASSCDSRRPTISFATLHLPGSSWPSHVAGVLI